MGILRPVRMTRVGILGLKDDRERILTALHDLRVAQIETLPPETLAQLAPERGNELQRRIGDETLRFRGLLSALPELPAGALHRFDSVDQILAAAATVPIDAEVGSLKLEDDRLLTEERTNDDLLALLDRITFYAGRLDDLRATSVLSFIGEAESDSYSALRAELPSATDATFLTAPGPKVSVRFILVVRKTAADALAKASTHSGVRLTAVPNLSGTPSEERARLTARRAEIVRRRAGIAERLGAVSREWYGLIAAIDEALTVENRKVEALQKFGAGRLSFAVEAWVPERDVARLQTVLKGVAQDRAYVYSIATKAEAPTLMDNPRGFRRFEFFIRFYSLPQADEWDPTFVFAIVFPLFFGFMLGDWGYGLTILLVSLWMIAGFPGASKLPKFGRKFVKSIMGPQGMQQLAWALIPGCLLAIALGLFWDEFFGYHLFGALFGYVPLLDPVRNTGKLLLFAGFLGLGMVTFGFLLGALKEYFHHHPKGVVGKLMAIVLAWGVAFLGLSLIFRWDRATDPVFVGSIAAIGVGAVSIFVVEGGQQTMLEFIEVLSHVLSYTRLVGILLASVILAVVINSISVGLIHGGIAEGVLGTAVGLTLGIVVGLLIIIVGQSFNVILGVFEPGIQGARLIFVEYFSKFYTGNGTAFRPFGGVRKRTVSSLSGTSGVPGPFIQGPSQP
ncbi:MAG: hypothetical protein L3J92_06205 [Thermoplasmata archaeon]|jgi:V/A-type H+-transporting ATPase subunit I|nr:hypothetical protein [Thermoplasmata archaeon]